MAEDDTTKFVDAVTRFPSLRRSLQADPLTALQAVSNTLGIDPSQVDLATLDAVSSLTEQELAVINSVRQKLNPEALRGHDGAIIF